jgi:23S rRNA maturation-related 3'-5' exoribonuclease YhaM
MLLAQVVSLDEEIRQAKKELGTAQNSFNHAEGHYVLVATYKLKAAEERYNSLIAERKRLTHGLVQV